MLSSLKRALARRRRRARMLLALGFVGGIIPVVGPADPASAACNLSARNETVTIGTWPNQRSYELYVPSGVTGPSTRLVVALHPGAVSAATWENGSLVVPASGWVAKANVEKFAVVHPQGSWPGLLNTWDPNTPPGASPANADWPFLQSLVNDVKTRVCVNDNQIHASGYSMGGWMSQRLACEMASTFASVGAGGAGHPELHDDWGHDHTGAWACSPSRPISVRLAMGTDDNDAYFAEARDEWLADNACNLTPTITNHVTVPTGQTATYSCASGTKVVTRTYDGYDHLQATVPYTSTGVDDEYAFFVVHPKP